MKRFVSTAVLWTVAGGYIVACVVAPVAVEVARKLWRS